MYVWKRHPVVTLMSLGSLMSRSIQGSGDELAKRLNLLLESQERRSEKSTKVATLLNEITPGTCLSVIVAMTNSVALCKEHTSLQEEFLNGMTHNLHNGKLTMSATVAVLHVFQNHCGNLQTVAIVQRAFYKLQQAHSHFIQVPTMKYLALMRTRRRDNEGSGNKFSCGISLEMVLRADELARKEQELSAVRSRDHARYRDQRPVHFPIQPVVGSQQAGVSNSRQSAGTEDEARADAAVKGEGRSGYSGGGKGRGQSSTMERLILSALSWCCG